MIVGMLLLDQDDCYVRDNGDLPKRPTFDKNLLLGLAQNQVPICSENTARDLPPSLKALMMGGSAVSNKGDLALSPDKIDEQAHLLIISRNHESGIGGKKFRFDKFKRVVSMHSLELWVRDYQKGD